MIPLGVSRPAGARASTRRALAQGWSCSRPRVGASASLALELRLLDRVCKLIAAADIAAKTSASATKPSPSSAMPSCSTSATSAADQFTFAVAAAPVVTAISPTSGPEAGGTLVTITGTGFTGATAVDFGTTAATNVTVVNDTTITANSPSGTGSVDVTVTTPLGTSPTSAADLFTYTAIGAANGRLSDAFRIPHATDVPGPDVQHGVNQASAQNVANYQIMSSGGAVIPISAAVYNASAMTVTLSPSQLLNIHDVYQLTVNGMPPNGLTSSTGVELDALVTGHPARTTSRRSRART